MADPFELWRLMWSFAISGGLEQLAHVVPGAAVAARPRVAYAIELSTFPTLGRVRSSLRRWCFWNSRSRRGRKFRQS